MKELTELLRYTVYIIIRTAEMLLFIRAIMSWFMLGRSNRVYDFLVKATEPLLLPFRYILDRIPVFSRMPVSFDVFFAIITLEIIASFLIY